MTNFAGKISDQIIDLEKECDRHERDSKFYMRLLIQLAMMNGGSISIDPKYGTFAVEYAGDFEINSTGFHLKPIQQKA